MFAAVGLDQADFAPSPTTQRLAGSVPPVYADAVTLWREQKLTDPATHVVMATRRGRLVYFRRLTPDSTRDGAAIEIGASIQSPTALFVSVMVTLAGVLALRNLKLGRTDIDGALHCALYFFSIDVVLWVVIGRLGTGGSHVVLGTNYLIRSLAMAFRVWLYYVAMEPFVRRYWPDVLISWSRLLSGRFRDPLVGRDLLIGCIIGIAWAAIALPVEAVFNFNPHTILGGRFVLASILTVHQYGLISGMVLHQHARRPKSVYG